jgi:hypothetical protein
MDIDQAVVAAVQRDASLDPDIARALVERAAALLADDPALDAPALARALLDQGASSVSAATVVASIVVDGD